MNQEKSLPKYSCCGTNRTKTSSACKKTLNMIKYTQVENKFIQRVHFIYLLISHTFVVPLPDNPDKRYNNSPNN